MNEPFIGPENRTNTNPDGNPQHAHYAKWCPACDWAQIDCSDDKLRAVVFRAIDDAIPGLAIGELHLATNNVMAEIDNWWESQC